MTTHLLSLNAQKVARGSFTGLTKGGDLSMKKKIIAVIVGFTILAICSCYLQFSRNMDIMNSISFSSSNYREESINVVLNKLIITANKKILSKASLNMYWIMTSIPSNSTLTKAIHINWKYLFIKVKSH